jgi:hypothetical protein
MKPWAHDYKKVRCVCVQRATSWEREAAQNRPRLLGLTYHISSNWPDEMRPLFNQKDAPCTTTPYQNMLPPHLRAVSHPCALSFDESLAQVSPTADTLSRSLNNGGNARNKYIRALLSHTHVHLFPAGELESGDDVSRAGPWAAPKDLDASCARNSACGVANLFFCHVPRPMALTYI